MVARIWWLKEIGLCLHNVTPLGERFEKRHASAQSRGMHNNMIPAAKSPYEASLADTPQHLGVGWAYRNQQCNSNTAPSLGGMYGTGEGRRSLLPAWDIK